MSDNTDPTNLLKILGSMQARGFLTPSMILAIRRWDEGLAQHSANAVTLEERIARVTEIMSDLNEPEKHARQWITQRESMDEGSDPFHRGRLDSEMCRLIRSGGVSDSQGEMRKDVANCVIETAYAMVVGLREEVVKAEAMGGSSRVEGGAGEITEGDYRIV